MKNLLYIFLSLTFIFHSKNLYSQEYTGEGYAYGVPGQTHKMPGKKISPDADNELNQEGVVTGYDFDIANLSGPNFESDEGVVFGIYTSGTPGDEGGQDIRGYSTNSDPEYAPIRWNFGSHLFRQSGQWVRYSIDFEEGVYNFIYRGRINSYAISSHKFLVKIFTPDNMDSPFYTREIDLSANFPGVGETAENILRIGGGDDETDWFKILNQISIDSAGVYVVELSTPEIPYSFSPWGSFTFNFDNNYNALPYKNDHWRANKDTIEVWQYDKIDDGTLFSQKDSGVSVGIYNPTLSAEGLNIRSYSDDPQYEVVNWDTIDSTFIGNGGWYNYSFDFQRTDPYFFCFKGRPLFTSESWSTTIKFIEPASGFLVKELHFSDSVLYLSDKDEGQATRWMYIDKPIQIPEGNYILQIDIPESVDKGIINRFFMTTANPLYSSPQVINYNWPLTIPESDKYEVKVYQDGNEIPIFTHLTKPDTRPSVYPPDNGNNGVIKEIEDRTMSFAQFSFTDEIIVEITKIYGDPASRVEVQPKAYGLNPHYFDGRTVRFKLTHQENRPSYIGVTYSSDDNLDNNPFNHKVPKHGMMIFADQPEVFIPDTTQPGTVIYNNEVDSATVVNAELIYFPPGDYDLKKKFHTGVIELTRSGQNVYIEGGAFVRGAVWAENKDNIWFYGRGIISGIDLLHHELLDDQGVKEAYLNFVGADGCHIEGLTITDPCHHTIPTGSNTYFKNVKIIGWGWNQDGIRVGGSSLAEEMFFKTNDDRDYADRAHTLRNSVMWPMRNGAFAILGWGPYDGGNSNYENLYFINSEWDRPEDRVGNQGVLGSRNTQGSNVAYVTLKDLYLEDYTTILTRLGFRFDESRPWNPSDPGIFHDFLFENIKVEHPFITSEGTRHYQVIEGGYKKDNVTPFIYNITFKNLVVAGELITEYNKDKYFKIDPNTTSNIRFEYSNDIHTIRVISNSGGNVFPDGDISVPDQTSQYVSIEPWPGYRIKDVKVDHQSVGKLQNIMLNDIISDHIVEVEFEAGNNNFDLGEVIDPNTVLTDTIKLSINHINTSVENIKPYEKLKVYPNPANDQIFVEGADDNEKISIFNIYGKLIMVTDEKVINIQKLTPGIYLIQSNFKTCRLVVK